jgi:hypothetical protein
MTRKLFIYLIAFSTGVFSAYNLPAQDTTSLGKEIKKDAKKTGQAIKTEAKKVGSKTAELASKGSSSVVDKVYDGKQGPDGQTVYINDKSEYYWVDKKGHRHFLTESELKDKNN